MCCSLSFLGAFSSSQTSRARRARGAQGGTLAGLWMNTMLMEQGWSCLPSVVCLWEDPLRASPACLGSHWVCGQGDHHTCPCKTSCSRGGKRMSDLLTMSEPSSAVTYLEPWCSTHVYHYHQYTGSLGRGQIPHPCWAPRSFNAHPCSLHPRDWVQREEQQC